MSQTIPLGGKPKTFHSLYFVFAQWAKQLFFAKQKSPFFHISSYFSTQTNRKKIDEFEVCLLNPYKQCLRKIVSIHQKFLFHPVMFVMGVPFDTLNKAC